MPKEYQLIWFFKHTALILCLAALFPLQSSFGYDFDFKNVLQSGLEYDSNIFKTYNTSVNDGLLRALYKSSAGLNWPSTKLILNYRLGGKKYFVNPEQDTMINSFEADFSTKLSPKFQLESTSEAKYQIETDKTDDLSLDINEDFLLVHQGLAFKFNPGRGLSVRSSAHFTLFDFNDDYPGLGYYQQRYGISIFKKITDSSQGGFLYSYNRYHFTDISRTDGLNDITFIYKYTSSFYASASYTLKMNSSTTSAFSFTNHKISIIASVPITFKRTNGNEKLDPDLVLSLIGILRLKDYASQVVIDSEGRRFLLSESEEDNFNIIILKITKNLNKYAALELKYTRHSNEFANTGQNYARSTIYLGGRFTF